MTYQELLASYGDFARYGAGLKLDPQKIPPQFHPLIPYARFWGISDDWDREAAVKAAPERVLSEFDQVVSRHVWELGEWLAVMADTKENMSREYLALSNMMMVFDRA